MSSVALRSSDDTGARPAGRRTRGGLFPRGGLFWLRTTLGSAAIVLALALLAHEPPQEPAPRPVPAAILVAPPPAWQPLADAKPRYVVDAPALKGLAQGFEARRHANGGREDKLVYGVFEADEPYLRLAVFRGPDEAGAPRSFFIDLARRAGEAGSASCAPPGPRPWRRSSGRLRRPRSCSPMGSSAPARRSGSGARRAYRCMAGTAPRADRRRTGPRSPASSTGSPSCPRARMRPSTPSSRRRSAGAARAARRARARSSANPPDRLQGGGFTAPELLMRRCLSFW